MPIAQAPAAIGNVETIENEPIVKPSKAYEFSVVFALLAKIPHQLQPTIKQEKEAAMLFNGKLVHMSEWT